MAFSKNNKYLTKECQRPKKDNMQTQWPIWKATLEGVEITKVTLLNFVFSQRNGARTKEWQKQLLKSKSAGLVKISTALSVLFFGTLNVVWILFLRFKLSHLQIFPCEYYVRI